MDDKKKTAPLATDGTAQTENGSIFCDYDSTVSAGNQDVFDDDLPVSDDGGVLAETYNGIIADVTEAYLSGIDPDNPPSPRTVERELLGLTRDAIDKYNLGPRDPSASPTASMKDAYPSRKQGDDRLRKKTKLEPFQIAMCVAHCHRARGIYWNGERDGGNFDIGLYCSDGDDAGIYDTDDENLKKVIRSYNRTISKRDVDEVMENLRAECVRTCPCKDPDLIAVNNGIFDYSTKVLLDFDPEYVFTSKCRVDYVEDAENPVITMPDGEPWDVVSWMGGLSDDPGVVRLLWEIVGAIIRPGVRWNKTVWFYSVAGNNGKGTLCALMRNLCGKGAWESIPLKAFSQEFMLEPLMRVSAVITDENDTSTYVDDAAALKSVITGDPFQLNRKFKDPRSVLFRGFMVQCVNELPRMRDRSESMYRRLLVVPFEKRFEGRERKYIKADYLGRKEVLEYVLWRVLYDTDYYALSEPRACAEMLREYRLYNDPVRDFLDEVLPQASWDLLPWSFLHDLFRHWAQRRHPEGRIDSKMRFTGRVKSIIGGYPGWSVTENAVNSAGRMDRPEPLIAEYEVGEWMNPHYVGNDPAKRCLPVLKDRYRGLVRTGTGPADVNPDFDPDAIAEAVGGAGDMKTDSENEEKE